MQDNQENMSVENILSSIKEILEDDADGKEEHKPLSSMDEGRIIDVEFDDEDDDDIIELSENQIIDETKVNIDEYLNNANASLVDEAEEKVFEENKDEKFVIEVSEPKIKEENIEIIEKTVEIKEEVKNEDVIKEDVDFNIESFVNSIDEVINNAQKEDIAKVNETQNIAEPVVEEKPVVVEEIKKAETKEDTSVEIINNFAKMFSASPVATPNIEIDNTMIEDVLQKEIAKKVMDINFDNIANAQIKKWLNDNLSLVVEKVVKEKLEEVLAKNGQ